jgi:hypothetical protein
MSAVQQTLADNGSCQADRNGDRNAEWIYNGVELIPEPFSGVWVATHSEARKVRGLRRNGQALVVYVRDKFLQDTRHCYGAWREWKEIYDAREERWMGVRI